MKRYALLVVSLWVFLAANCSFETQKQQVAYFEDEVVGVSPLVDFNSYDPHKIRVYVPPYTYKGAVKAEEAVSVTLKTAEKNFSSSAG